MLEAIKTRRSIRKYTNKKVSKKDIQDLLKAAMQAPTARNAQEWKFIVCQDKEILEKFANSCANYHMLHEASAMIVVFGAPLVGGLKEFVYEDCGAAIQNILLEATSKGIGTCWCAIGPVKDRIKTAKEAFPSHADLIPVALVALGYPNETKGFDNRYDEKKVTWL